MPPSRCVECSHGQRKPGRERKEPRAGGSQEKGQGGRPSAKEPFVLLSFVCEVCVQRHAKGCNYRGAAKQEGESVGRKVHKRVRIEEDATRGEAGRSPEPQKAAQRSKGQDARGVPVEEFADQGHADPLGAGEERGAQGVVDSPEEPLRSAGVNAMIEERTNVLYGKQSEEASGLQVKGKSRKLPKRQGESADSTAPKATSSVVLTADRG